MAKTCKGCKFWRPLSGDKRGLYACHFLLDTGIPRCCPAEECIYNKKGLNDMPKGKRVSPEIIGQIGQMSAEGKTIPQICEALGVGASTVSRVRNGKLKSPPAAATAEGDGAEAHEKNVNTHIITDNPGNVKRVPSGTAQNSDSGGTPPGVVVDALLEKIQNISEKIETEEKYLAALKADKKSLERWYHENCTAFGRDYKRRNKVNGT